MPLKDIEQYLIDFQKKQLPVLVKRSLKIPATPKIKAVIGPRRAGKTFFLHQLMEEMIEHGTPRQGIVYLNFENTRLFDITFREIRDVIDASQKLFPSGKKPALFFDEPQNISFWEKAVRELHDDGFDIFISGSSSKLLGREIATSLRGRSLSYILLPFSFSEFISVKKIFFSATMSSAEKMDLIGAFDDYLQFGGFPEIVLEKEKELKLKIIDNYIDLIVYRDIVERYHVKDSILVKWFIKSLILSYSKELSINKIYLTLRSQGRKISRNELYSYASMFNDSLFVFYLPKFSWSIRKREPVSKVYLSDTGFANIAETRVEKGRRMENIVYLELLRRKNTFTELFYYKDSQGHEADFVLKEGGRINQIVQVCHNIAEMDTKKREVRALLKAGRELKCKNLLVITGDYMAEEEAEWFGIKGKIKFIPIWKWLLE